MTLADFLCVIAGYAIGTLAVQYTAAGFRRISSRPRTVTRLPAPPSDAGTPAPGQVRP